MKLFSAQLECNSIVVSRQGSKVSKGVMILGSFFALVVLQPPKSSKIAPQNNQGAISFGSQTARKANLGSNNNLRRARLLQNGQQNVSERDENRPVQRGQFVPPLGTRDLVFGVNNTWSSASQFQERKTLQRVF